MSIKVNKLKDEVQDLEMRLKSAEEAHDKARMTFSNFQGVPAMPMWDRLRGEVERTLVHKRVMEAILYRAKAALADQQAMDRE